MKGIARLPVLVMVLLGLWLAVQTAGPPPAQAEMGKVQIGVDGMI